MRVCVRGMGELGSAVAHLLWRMGYHVIGTELPTPLAIRRPVCFSEAMLTGKQEVLGVTAVHVDPAEVEATLEAGKMPIVNDTEAELDLLGITILVDARMLKQAVPDLRGNAPMTVGLGPGFHAGKNCDVVVETARGHDLGRLIWVGEAQANTGIPGELGGSSSDRLIRSPGEGRPTWKVEFGDSVKKDQAVGTLDDGTPILVKIDGIIRGMISEQLVVTKDMKIGDVDPRGLAIDHSQISEKARLIAYGVLEGITLLSRGMDNE